MVACGEQFGTLGAGSAPSRMLDLPTIHAPSSEAWNHPCRRQFYRAATEDVKRCEKHQRTPRHDH